MSEGWSAAATAAINMWSQERANQSNEDIAHDQSEFQERMSSTAYQRAMADMRLAGLNPILAFEKGGASTPPGGTTRVDPILDGKSISAALQVLFAQKELDKIEQETETLKSQDLQAATQAAKNRADTELSDAMRRKTEAEEKYTDFSAKHLYYALPAAENRADVEKSEVGKYGAWLDRIMESVGKVLHPPSSALSRRRGIPYRD